MRGAALRAFGTLSHVRRGDGAGAVAAMVDVGHKPASLRRARVRARVSLPWTSALEDASALSALYTTAVCAGTLAAKRTAGLIPMCHPLGLEHVAIDIARGDAGGGPGRTALLIIEAEAVTRAGTGVEMEAFVGASVAALTLVDMLKSSVPPGGVVVEEVRLLSKTGGKSDFQYKPEMA